MGERSRAGLRLLALCAALALGGCGTIGSLASPWSYKEPSKIYGGVRNDWSEIGQETGPCRPGPLLIVDLPFSFALDTLLLPITVCYELFFRPAAPPEKRGKN